eukprot:1152295-Pelagomonas_calceolata.AAC.4
MTTATAREATTSRPPSNAPGPSLDLSGASSASSQAAAPSVGSHNKQANMLWMRHERQLQGPKCSGPSTPLSSSAAVKHIKGMEGANSVKVMSDVPCWPFTFWLPQ